jgi:hypothetical protein
MDFDLEDGLYIFEITLGYTVAESENMTVPLLIKADDVNDAEEVVQEYLEINNLAGDFWIADITGPFDPEKYQKEVDEGERERWDRMDDYSEEDFLEIIHSEDT